MNNKLDTKLENEPEQVNIVERIVSFVKVAEISSEIISGAFHTLKNLFSIRKNKPYIAKYNVNKLIDLADNVNGLIAQNKEEKEQISVLSSLIREAVEESKLPRY